MKKQVKKKQLSSSFIKAVGYAALKTICPGSALIGLFFWLYWLARVTIESKDVLLSFLGIISFIVIAFVMCKIIPIFTREIFSDTFIKINETYLVLEKTGSNTYEIRKQTDNGSWVLFFAVFIGPIVGALSILLFLINLIRLIYSKKLRIIYNEYFDGMLTDIKEAIRYEKLAVIIIAIIAFVYFVPTTIYAAHIQTINNIDIFQDFKDLNDNGKEYIKPSLRATNISVESGGSYINGLVVEIDVKFSYSGNVDISSMSGIITVYNSNNTKLLEANCSFNFIENNQIQTLYIECNNSPKITELSYYSINEISIYYTSQYIFYNDCKMIEENITKKIN